MKYKDYYKILEVSPEASAEEVKLAYRRLARRYHPDVSNDYEAEERFKEVAEAYEVLGDPERRAAYDRSGCCRNGQTFRRWDGRLDETAPGSGSLEARDLEASLVITVEEAYHGTERTLSLVGTDEVKVQVPAGVQDGQRLRIAGKGLHGAGGRVGDLYLHISIIAHDLYRIKGKTILLDVPITPWEAALGTTLLIPTPSGRVRVRVSPGSMSGQKLRLPGRGMPGAGGRGDFYARLQIVVPTELGEEEKALYRRLGELSRFDPRAHFPP